MSTPTTAPLRINGLSIDAAAIGSGIYAMICNRDEAAIVAFGMIPKWAIDTLETALRAKIIAEAAKQVGGITPDELEPFVDAKMLADTMRPITHAVIVEIYQAASDAGAMCV